MKNFILIILLVSCTPKLKPLSQAEMDKAFQESNTISQGHKELEKLVGTWKTSTKLFSPNSTEETKGISKNSLIYSGRFLKQELKSKFMGSDFKGISYTGFSNNEYQSTWMDSLTNQITISKGSFKDNTFTFIGESSCPVTKRTLPTEEKITIINNNTYTYSLSVNKQKVMEVSYNRK